MLIESQLPISQLCYLEQTADSPFCLVMLHGWMDNAASFIPLLQSLPDYHCIALDFPGHGHSPHRQGHYHFVDYVDDLFSALSELNLNKPIILVGHSLGALVASTYAAAFGEGLLALIAIDGLGPLSLPISNTTTHLADAIRQRHRSMSVRGFTDLNQAIRLRARSNGLSRENSRLLVTRATKQSQGLWYWRHDPKLKLSSPLRFSESQAKQICQSIQRPCLLIAAQEHPLLSAEFIRQRQTWFSQLSIVELVGGHHLHMQNSAACAALMTNYIQTIV
ncbi:MULTISPECIES: alpha/beta fold hydrolase [unclassified Agarivorans]|uniref:alpha/beta fold hydrolase n=1 Tax=unclassified Agarivorans TaxID=2636026 RepID=UPI003D7DDB55